MTRGALVTFRSVQSGRLDRILAQASSAEEALRGVTRSQIKRLIERGDIRVNGAEVCKAGFQVDPGDEISLSVQPQESASLPSYEYPLSILYEDESVLVIDKPSGLSMHPGAGNSSTTLVNAFLHYFRASGNLPDLMRTEAELESLGEHSSLRPGIVHRLDKDTTGVVVVAKTVSAHAHLADQFAKRSVGRRYLALAFLTPRGRRALNLADTGTIDAALGRHRTERKEMAIVERGGKRAVTNWEVLERFGYGCLVRLKLETGRTHQIRLHLTHIGSPIIGDRTYGEFSGLPAALRREHEHFGRQALHAQTLEFDHPVSGIRQSFESPVPSDMAKLIEAFRRYGHER